MDIDEVNEEDFYMDEVEVEEVVAAVVVAVAVVVEAMKQEVITIVTTIMEGRIAIMDLIHQILQETLHLKKSWILFKIMYG